MLPALLLYVPCIAWLACELVQSVRRNRELDNTPKTRNGSAFLTANSCGESLTSNPVTK